MIRSAASTSRAAAAVDRRLRRGILVTVAGVVVLSLFTGLPFREVMGLPFFYLLLPALALAQLPLLGAQPLERIPVYLGSAATILLLGAVGLAMGAGLVGWEGMGIRALPSREFVGWTLGSTAAGIVIIGLLGPLDRRWPGRGSEFLLDLLPRTREEKGVFAGLSLSAGVGEELAYRGYALVAVQLLGPGPWLAAGLSSIAFGLLHAYQGAVGVFRTALMGFVLALPVLMSGSILPSILAHALIDLIAGLIIGPRMVRRVRPGPDGTHGSVSARAPDRDPLVRPPRDG